MKHVRKIKAVVTHDINHHFVRKIQSAKEWNESARARARGREGRTERDTNREHESKRERKREKEAAREKGQEDEGGVCGVVSER